MRSQMGLDRRAAYLSKYLSDLPMKQVVPMIRRADRACKIPVQLMGALAQAPAQAKTLWRRQYGVAELHGSRRLQCSP